MAAPTIEFLCDNWAIRKHAPVVLARDLKPAAWRDLPPEQRGQPTAKHCPAINDWLSQGYILRAWCEMRVDPTTTPIGITYADPDYKTNKLHADFQVGRLLKSQNAHGYVLKLDNPWSIKTAPGWSVQFLPLWYWEESPWQALPGIIDTDVHHTNCPINMALRNLEPFTVSVGDPIVQILPFYRQAVDACSRAPNLDDRERARRLFSQLKLKFIGTKRFFQVQKKFNLVVCDVDV